jgi:septal ring factor EnvC (AmiA/AmiB activator)
VTRLARIVFALLVAVLAVPAIAQVTDEDIDRARQEVNRILADSEALGRDVQEAWSRQFVLEHEIETLRASIEFARVEIIAAEKKLEEAAVELYMESTSTASIQIGLFSVSDEKYGAAIAYLEELSGEEEELIDQLRSFRAELDRQTARLEEASAEQQVLASELEVMATQLQGELIKAQAVYDELLERQLAEEEALRLAEEKARRAAEEAARNTTTTAAPAPTTSPSTSTPSDTTGLLLGQLGGTPVGWAGPPGCRHDRRSWDADRRDLRRDDQEDYQWQSQWSGGVAPFRQW